MRRGATLYSLKSGSWTVTTGRLVRGLSAAGALSLVLYAGLALAGDLRSPLNLYLAVHAVLFGLYAAVIVLVLRAVPAGGRRDRPASGSDVEGPERRRWLRPREIVAWLRT